MIPLLEQAAIACGNIVGQCSASEPGALWRAGVLMMSSHRGSIADCQLNQPAQYCYRASKVRFVIPFLKILFSNSAIIWIDKYKIH